MCLTKSFTANVAVQAVFLAVVSGLSMSASAVLVIDYQGLDRDI